MTAAALVALQHLSFVLGIAAIRTFYPFRKREWMAIPPIIVPTLTIGLATKNLKDFSLLVTAVIGAELALYQLFTPLHHPRQ